MAPGMNHCEGGKINPPGPSIARIERGAPMKLRNPKFLTVSALCGSLGVLSGYAIYLTYEHVKGGVKPGQWGGVKVGQ
jgi:hypothetical protein